MDRTPPEGSLGSPSGGDPERHRPLERRAAVRTAVVWEAVRQVLAPAHGADARVDDGGDNRADRDGGTAARGGAATVVDIGGGTGGFAVRLAELGHRVTVVDPSPDALAALGRRAAESNVADRVTGEQGDLANLVDLVGAQHADLVLCHGVLGILDDPAAALGTIGEVLRPGGTLSLLVGQRHAAVLARAMAGHFRQARAVLEGTDGSGEHRFTATEITDLLSGSGFTPQAVQAVRVFADLVPGSLLDLEPGASAALLDLERVVADRPEYLTLAAQLHVLARH